MRPFTPFSKGLVVLVICFGAVAKMRLIKASETPVASTDFQTRKVEDLTEVMTMPTNYCTRAAPANNINAWVCDQAGILSLSESEWHDF